MSELSARRAPLVAGLFAWLACALAWAGPGAARARAEASGGVDGRGLFGIDGRHGGAVMADVWATRGWLRPGGAYGIAALSANDEASSRVLTPLAFSLALMPSGGASGLVGIARLGGYAGAEKGGFIKGGFASCTLGYGFALGEGASVRLAAEAWGILGVRGGVFFGPVLGLGF